MAGRTEIIFDNSDKFEGKGKKPELHLNLGKPLPENDDDAIGVIGPREKVNAAMVPNPGVLQLMINHVKYWEKIYSPEDDEVIDHYELNSMDGQVKLKATTLDCLRVKATDLILSYPIPFNTKKIGMWWSYLFSSTDSIVYNVKYAE